MLRVHPKNSYKEKRCRVPDETPCMSKKNIHLPGLNLGLADQEPVP
jgi:hypothetical protein